MILNNDESFQTRIIQTQRKYIEFSSRNLYSIIDSDIDSNHRLAISKVCWRPELKPLLKDANFTVRELNDSAFILMKNEVIAISSNILKNPAATAFHLRHALELIALRSCLNKIATHIDLLVLALASFHTALQYLDNMIDSEKHAVLASLPDWIKQAAEGVSYGTLHKDAGHKSLQVIASGIDDLLLLQEQAYLFNTSDIRESDINHAIQKAFELLPLLNPTEKILTLGGDNRLLISKKTGLNTYGCSPRPRPWAITFSSSTGSSISDLAYQEAEWLRQRLLAKAFKDGLINGCADEYTSIKKEISDLLYLERVPGTKIVLTPSGTDSELYALYFAMGEQATPTRNILISSTEVGSGTVHAAKGCHFDALTPLGKPAKQSAPLDSFPSQSVTLSVLELRHEDGELKTMEKLDQELEFLVESSLASGQRVLIHLLDCSKTGIGGPSFETVKQIHTKYQSKIEVMVDAAQMRVGQSALHRYLEEGFMVLISGSKFFTGPPFSGALLVPPSISRRIKDFSPLPKGFAEYSSVYELPSEWEHLTTSTLQKNINFGLLLRWRAALCEMGAFHSVSAFDQFNTISIFGTKIMQMIEANPDLQLVMAPPHTRGYLGSDLCWDQLPSIFTFKIYRNVLENKPHALSYDEARFAYQCINLDIARFLPVLASDREYELARKRCHIGQPVRLQESNGEWIGALRIAAGARLVSGVQFDDAFGRTPAERLDTEIKTVGVVFNKLSVIVKYWDTLNSYDLSIGHSSGAGYYQF